MKSLLSKLLASCVVCWALPVFAQDSLSRTSPPCLPGDAVSPWADASGPFGSEQCNDYVVDLDTLHSSWGTTFGIAPLVKSSKTGANFFSSLTSAQSMSRRQLSDVPFARSQYALWSDVGFGVNNNPAINDPGSLIDTSNLTGHQFAVVFAEFATTDLARNYNGIIGALVNYQPSEPARLYVSRVVAGTNSCDNNSNLSQFGVGAVDESGTVHVRADGFGTTGGCALANLTGNNIYRFKMAGRNCGARNVVSNDFLAGGQFDLPATEWLVRSSATSHNTPNIMPASVTGGTPLYLGTNFGTTTPFTPGKYLRGPAFGSITADSSHLAATVVDHRGNLSYTSKNCPLLNSTHGLAAVIGKLTPGASDPATVLNVFGLNAAGDVTGTLKLELPAVVMDNSTGFTNLPGVNVFDHYHSQVAFRGGNGQIALGLDQQGNLLAAAQVSHPVDGGANWPVNYIAVAKANCQTGAIAWTMAGYNDGTIGQSGTGKPILDGPGGNVIGRMVTLDNVTGGAPFGPSVSAPMIDSVGNVYFLSAMEIFRPPPDPSVFTNGLLRAVYNPANFSYELELLFRLGDRFHGRNANRDYIITFMSIADSNSVDSATAWSQNISETAHLNADPGNLEPRDPRTLGGMVLAAQILYDYDNDGVFDACTGTGGNPNSADQDYNVLLYVGAEGGEEPCGDFDGDGDVDLSDFTQFQLCFGGSNNPPAPTCPPGVDADCDADGDVDLADFLIFQQNFTGSR